MTSPAFARAIRVFNPNSEERPVDTNRSNAAATRRASAAAGSASMIRASTSRVNAAHASVSTYGVVASSTNRACAAVRSAACTIRATCRAFHTRPFPSASACHSRGWRCCRSRASRIRLPAAMNPMPITSPSSADANSATCGVPSPPGRTARSPPRAPGLPAPGVPEPGVPESRHSVCGSCRAAQCAASTSSCHSWVRSASWVAVIAAHAVSASSSATQDVSNMCSSIPARWPRVDGVSPAVQRESAPSQRESLPSQRESAPPQRESLPSQQECPPSQQGSAALEAPRHTQLSRFRAVPRQCIPELGARTEPLDSQLRQGNPRLLNGNPCLLNGNPCLLNGNPCLLNGNPCLLNGNPRLLSESETRDYSTVYPPGHRTGSSPAPCRSNS